MVRQRGSVFFYIFIGVFLFGLFFFSYGRSGGLSTVLAKKGSAKTDAIASDQCSLNIGTGAEKLALYHGCAESEISYEYPDGVNVNPQARPDKSCHVFKPQGANVRPCGSLLAAATPAAPDPCGSVALGAGCSVDGALYIGSLAGNRLYLKTGDEPQSFPPFGTPWAANFVTTNATSGADGKANTDKLMAMIAIGEDHPAARLCRALGPQWYLPAKDELALLYSNRASFGGLAAIGMTESGYHSSNENTSNTNYWLSTNFGTLNTSGNKRGYKGVRCVRRESE